MIEVLTNKFARELEQAATWYSSIFLCPFEDLYITVVTFEDAEENESLYGAVHKSADEEYTIELSDKISLKDTVRCLFHEFTHTYQFVSGRMADDMWEGVPEKNWPNYETQPWEIEAHAMEEYLFKLYKEHLNA